MAIVPKVVCPRCRERYSVLRSSCPNCGTRKVSQSSRAPGTTPGTVKDTASYDRANANTKWQMLFGSILVVAVILAVIVMVSTSLAGLDSGVVKPSATPGVEVEAPPVVEAAPTPPPTPTPTVETIDIMFYTTKYNDPNGPTMRVGDEALEFTASAWPATIENPVYEWTCDNPDCLKLTPSTDDNGKTCLIECIGSIAGGVKVTVSCFGVESTMRIYCLAAN